MNQRSLPILVTLIYQAVLTCPVSAATLSLALALAIIAARAAAQDMTFDEIRSALRNNPPTAGDPLLREEAILSLDTYLNTNNWPRAETKGFYRQMTGLLQYELSLPVPTGARIWQMYNHGFIVKTPSTVFAFDLVQGYFWLPVPYVVLDEIDVLFTSHSHPDHSDSAVQSGVAQSGGELVSVIRRGANVDIGGLNVVAYYGEHGGLYNNIFQVTTPEGLTFMHTGDTQDSQYLPSGTSVDVLLVNAWMNESGGASATVGVRNAVNRVAPSLTIPGHIHELGHQLEYGRAPYEWALAVDDVPIPGELAVLAWGEYIDYGVARTAAMPTAFLPPTGLFSAFDLDIDGLGDFVDNRATVPVGEFDDMTNRIERLIAKFDLPNLSQSHARIKNATLRLFLDQVVGTPQGPASLFHSLSDNDEVELVTDYENDTYRDTLLDLVQPTDAAGQYYELDVTDLVLADYAAEGRAAAVSAFRLQVNEAAFVEDNASRRYVFTTTIAHPVELVITFVPEPTTATLLGVAMLLLARRRRGWDFLGKSF